METQVNVESEAGRTVLNVITSRFGDAVVSELQPIIDAIAASLREGRRFENHCVSVTLPVVEGQTLTVSVHTGNASAKPEPPTRGLDAQQLRLIDGAIEERIAEAISVAMLSSLAGLSRSYFSQAFRKSVGHTPHKHVMRARIVRAMELMAQSDVPLSQIALATGFCDQAHFTNTFRRAAGLTPTQWRKRHRTSRTLVS